MVIDCAGKPLDVSTPAVMGILNVTPDSFSDGGLFYDPQKALAQAQRMVEEGAAVIDIGGESTRPGAAAVSAEEEIARIVPVIEALAAHLPVPISVDTSKPEVMVAAVEAGAGFLNDVYGLRQPEAVATAARLGVPVCVMHMQGEPRTMQAAPSYTDVVTEVREFLVERVEACLAAGISAERIFVDPGFGFGKSLEHNLRLLHDLPQFDGLGAGVLVGMSRKSMIGTLLDAPVNERLAGSLAAASIAAWLGARIIRVHDVRATVDALKVVAAVRGVD